MRNAEFVLAAGKAQAILHLSNSLRKEGKIVTNMKAIALAALAALTFCLGACASSSSQPTSTSAPASSGYSK
jgi:hypothetical protein